MKISIRTGVLVLFASLFIVTGIVIIKTDRYAEDKMLLRHAENLIGLACYGIEIRIYNFLQPIVERGELGGRLLKNKIVVLDSGQKATDFLLQTLFEHPGLIGSFWCNEKSDCNILTRDQNNTFTNEIVTQTRNGAIASTRRIDGNGAILEDQITTKTTIDPRTRPWYKKLLQRKTPVFSDVYALYPIGKQRSEPGITGVYPIFNKDKTQLLGVFGIDISLMNLSLFLGSIHVTPNTFTFIFDDKDNLIAAKTSPLFGTEKIPKVTDIDNPWVEASFKEYKNRKSSLKTPGQQNQQVISFDYTFAGEKYLAYYKNIKYAVEENWYIATIIPVNDILGEFLANLWKLTFIAIFILALGLVGVWFLAKLISKPIIKLTEEASAIKQLELPKIVKIKSYIKEINYLQDTFNSMKQSLQSFIRYVPTTLVKKLIISGDIAHVGGENKKLTFMFCDIQHFTAIAENMEPRQLMSYLSEYFGAMTKVILDNKGTLDKYIGDAIMAFWGAPLDDNKQTLHACQSAVMMLEKLKMLNYRWQQIDLPQLSVRIGIHTGNAVVGNVGSEYKLSYTSIGDSVNLCSRLEELNKVYESQIIISASTYQTVKNLFYTRLLDHVAVRGKQEGVYIYELLPLSHPLIADLEDYNRQFIAAFVVYQQGDWEHALKLFNEALVNYPFDKLLQTYIERCILFRDNPPENWQGIWKYEYEKKH